MAESSPVTSAEGAGSEDTFCKEGTAGERVPESVAGGGVESVPGEPPGCGVGAASEEDEGAGSGTVVGDGLMAAPGAAGTEMSEAGLEPEGAGPRGEGVTGEDTPVEDTAAVSDALRGFFTDWRCSGDGPGEDA